MFVFYTTSERNAMSSDQIQVKIMSETNEEEKIKVTINLYCMIAK